MMNTVKNCLLTLLLAAPSCCITSAFAQVPAPKKAAANPDAATTPPAEAAPPVKDPTDVGPPLETDPAIKSALALPRKRPSDYVQTITWLIQLGRPDLAKPILDELAKLQLTDAQRAELVAEVGSHNMLKLAR